MPRTDIPDGNTRKSTSSIGQNAGVGLNKPLHHDTKLRPIVKLITDPNTLSSQTRISGDEVRNSQLAVDILDEIIDVRVGHSIW